MTDSIGSTPPLLTRAAAESTAGDVAALLTSGDIGLRRAVTAALETGAPQACQVERTHLMCFRITVDQRAAGTLILGARATASEPADQTRRALTLIGPWFGAAVEAHLSSPPGAEDVLERVSAFHRILRDATADESDRALVRVLADTLAVWHDVAVLGYIEGQDGAFTRDTTLPGADLTRSPATIAAGAAPVGTDLAQLPNIEIDRLGFSAEHLAIRRFGAGPGSWLIAMEADLSPDEVTTLELYLDLLDDAIRQVAVARTARAGAAATGCLFDGRAQPADQALHAMAEMRMATRTSRAALAVTSATGTPLVRVASHAEPDTPQASGPDVPPVILVRSAPGRYVAKIGLEFPPGAGPTHQDYRVAETIADVIGTWVPWAQTHGAGAERRAFPEAFATVLERAAGQALARGETVTLILFSSQALALSPHASQDQLAPIRGHVRAGDLVGLLADDELGVLLRASGGERRATTARRLRHIVEESLAIPARALRMAVVTRTPASGKADTLVHEARTAISGSA